MLTPPPQIACTKVILELSVNFNHPGVMSHICNLFARRAFNVEGILCMPVADGTRSRIWLLVCEDSRLGADDSPAQSSRILCLACADMAERRC